MNPLLRPLLIALHGSLALAIPASGAASALPGPHPALQGGPVMVRLAVNSGRVILVTDEGVRSVTQERSIEPFVGSGHLEVAPGSRVTLSWRGLGSLELEGPAAIAWQEPQSPAGLFIHANVLNRADIEVRKLPMRLQLPGDWRADLPTGAYSIYSMGNGGHEFLHHAGHQVTLSWMGGAMVTAPVAIVAGSAFRMEAFPEVQVHGSRDVRVPSWSHSSWPWGKGGIGGLPDINLQGAPGWGDGAGWPWAEEPSPQEPWEKWDWPWQAPGTGDNGTGDNGTGDPGTEPPRTEGQLPGTPPAEGSRNTAGPSTQSPVGGESTLAREPATLLIFPGTEPAPRSQLGDVPSRGLGAPPMGATVTGKQVALPSNPTLPSEPALLSKTQGDQVPLPPDLQAARSPSRPQTPAEERPAKPNPWAGPAAPSPPSEGEPVDGIPVGANPAKETASEKKFAGSAPMVDRPAEPQGSGLSKPQPAGRADRAPEAFAPPGADPPAPHPESTETPPNSSQPTPKPISPRGHQADQWRGLPEDQIIDKGPFRHQKGTDLEVLRNGEGGWVMRLDPAAPQPYWFFSSRLDVRIFPGATLEVDRNGYLGHNTGLLRILSGHSDRVF